MTSAQEIRDRLEGYARSKIASVMQPLTEQLLVDQPGDPIEYMVRYLVQNRSDLRKHVVRCEWLSCARRGLPSARAC